MDGWSADFPLPAFGRAETPDLDIDSLLDFASQSLQPIFEQSGGLKTPPLSYNVTTLSQMLLQADCCAERALYFIL